MPEFTFAIKCFDPIMQAERRLARLIVEGDSQEHAERIRYHIMQNVCLYIDEKPSPLHEEPRPQIGVRPGTDAIGGLPSA